MKVAFDVQGTLLGSRSDRVVSLFRAFQSLGVETLIWSFGGRSMARDAATELELKPDGCISKVTKNYEGEDMRVDLCIDDDSQSAQFLSAKEFILVKDLPESESDIRTLALKYLIKYADKE